ncbi:hypothetical protein C5O28_09680 [Limosilactobacillus fermentum]|nr:hypothetical protein C5O28_09680 [Limosilactobacillus fermentum]
MAGFNDVFNLHNPPPKCFTSLRYQVILSPICFMSKGELIVETLIDRLRAVRAFRNLPASALTKIAQIASPPTTYQAGELISDGQGDQALLLVVAGKAKVSLLTADGNENILYLLKGGDVDGQAALFVRQPRLACLIEAVYPTTVIRLRHDAFQDLLASSPLLARKLLNSFAPGWPN